MLFSADPKLRTYDIQARKARAEFVAAFLQVVGRFVSRFDPRLTPRSTESRPQDFA